jgi:translocation and assembly module TamA
VGICAASSFPALADTELKGLDEPMLSNALALLGLDDESCEAPEWRVAEAYRDAPEEIRSALEAFGYYSADIESTFGRTEDCWSATFEIDPGEPVRLRTVDLELRGDARDDPAFDTALDVPALAPGQPLLHAEYEQLKDSLMESAQQRGYVEARFVSSRIDVYPDERAADLELILDSGPRYRFGAIVLEQDFLDDEFVLAYLGFSEGDYYNARALTNVQLELIDSGFFSDIRIVPQTPDSESRQIPVTIILRPAPRKLLSYGIGMSTDTGVRVRFGRSIRRFNDRGHQLNFNSQLSPVVSEVNAIYRVPYGDPRTDWLSFDAGGKREYTDTSKSRSIEFGARRVHQINQNWMRTQFVSLLVEDFDIANDAGRSRLLMPGMEWSRLRADNSLRPRRGSKLVTVIRGAADNVGSDTSFVQLIAEGKWIWSVAAKSRLLVRSEIGATADASFNELPPSVRFFAGGDESVRGYDFETLGPVDAEGRVTGGSRLFTASVEYEHEVKARWSVAVFGDTGNAFNASDLNLYSGFGIGARWQSPLGPIRLDVAKPLDGPDRGLRVHINLGPDL